MRPSHKSYHLTNLALTGDAVHILTIHTVPIWTMIAPVSDIPRYNTLAKRKKKVQLTAVG